LPFACHWRAANWLALVLMGVVIQHIAKLTSTGFVPSHGHMALMVESDRVAQPQLIAIAGLPSLSRQNASRGLVDIHLNRVAKQIVARQVVVPFRVGNGLDKIRDVKTLAHEGGPACPTSCPPARIHLAFGGQGP